jgi:hypothetical protein
VAQQRCRAASCGCRSLADLWQPDAVVPKSGGLPAGGSIGRPVQCLAAVGAAAPQRRAQHHHPPPQGRRGPQQLQQPARHCRGHHLQPSCMPPPWSSACQIGQRPGALGQKGSWAVGLPAQARHSAGGLQDQRRSSGQQLFACFVDFQLQQAYNTVRRSQLWENLHADDHGGEWLRAVQALSADVPMAVRTADGVSALFQARIGLKQGCPASPTLFGLYIDDFEAAVLAADAAALAASQQQPSGAAATEPQSRGDVGRPWGGRPRTSKFRTSFATSADVSGCQRMSGDVPALQVR